MDPLTRKQKAKISAEDWIFFNHADHGRKVEVEFVKRLAKPDKPMGKLEEELMAWTVQTNAQITLSYLPCLSSNRLEFNAIRASERAASFFFQATRMLAKKYPQYRFVLKSGERQRYAVPGYAVAGMTFGKGGIVIEGAADIIEATRNIYQHYSQNLSNVGPLIGVAEEGTLTGFNDDFYFDKRLVAPWIDATHVIVDPTRPIEEFVGSLALAAGVGIQGVRIVVLYRKQRHWGTEVKNLIRRIIDQGVPIDENAPDEIEKIINERHIYENGNLILVDNDFFPFEGMIGVKNIHGLVGAGGAPEGELLSYMNCILGGKGAGMAVSRDALSERNNVDFDEDKTEWSSRDIGLWRELAAKGHSSAAFFNEVWTPKRPKDLGLAIGHLKPSYWDKDIQGCRLDLKKGYFVCDELWIGASGDSKIFRVKIPIQVPLLVKKIRESTDINERFNLTLDLVDCYGNLGEFSRAFVRLNALIRNPLLTPEMVRKAEAANCRILAFYELSRNPSGLKGMKKAMAHLEKVVELDPDDGSSKRLLRRMWNSRADKARLLAEKIMDRNIRIKRNMTKRAEVAFREASHRYERAMNLFPQPVVEGGTSYTLYRSGLGLLDKLKLEQSRWEYQIDVQQKKIIDHRLAVLSGELDWNQRQLAFDRIADWQEALSRLLSKGYQRKAVEYQERMLKTLAFMGSTFEHETPRHKIKMMGRTYMDSFRWEEALATFACLILPESAFKVYSPEQYVDCRDDTTKALFFDGIYYSDLYVKFVLKDYLEARGAIRDEAPDLMKKVLANADPWLEGNREKISFWAKDGRIRSDDRSVVRITLAEGVREETMELFDLIARHKAGRNGGDERENDGSF